MARKCPACDKTFGSWTKKSLEEYTEHLEEHLKEGEQ